MSDSMYGFTVRDMMDAIRYFSDKVAFEEENYYEACQRGIAERDCAKERGLDLMRIAVYCMKKELAFDKQEPLIPFHTINQYGLKVWRCGSCESGIDKSMKYCYKCGHKIKWEEDDDDDD